MKTTVRLFFLLGLIAFIPGLKMFSQVSINNDGSQPDNSAMLDIKSDTKGILIPRMTTSQIQLIYNPADGLIVYCTTNSRFYVYLATENTWREMLYGTGTLTPPFRCGIDLLADKVNGNSYGTIQLGNQCWMAENLKAKKYNDDTDIPLVTDNTAWSSPYNSCILLVQ